jgi:hypothetical protein
MKSIHNEKGAALIYVVMISLVLTSFITVILMIISNSQLSAISSESEKEVTNLAVSGMQSLLRYHLPSQTPNPTDQLTFIKNNLSGICGSTGCTGISIKQPTGETITFRQYLIPSTIPDSQALDLSNVVLTGNIATSGTQYKLVTTATVGDNVNPNQMRDPGENSFKIKSLVRPIGVNAVSSLKEITAYSFAAQTKAATIDSSNRTIIIEVASGTNLTNLVADFTISPDATVKVGTTVQALNCSGQANRGCTTANNFSNSTTTPFIYTITAADGSSNDWTVVVTQVGGAGGNGIVWNVDANGNRTPQPFGNTLTSSTTLVLSSSIGTVSFTGSYSFQATNGIVIEPGVSITSTGSNSTVNLASSGGSITIPSTFLQTTGNGNSSPYDININAALDIDIRGATIEAQRDIAFTAGRKIYAQNAIINNFKNNGNVSFTITNPTADPTNTKIFYVDNLKVNQPATAGTTGIKICGALASGSSSINGFSSFTGGYCN